METARFPPLALFGLPLLDLSVVAAYLGITVAIGIWSRKKNRTSEDYFLGGRKFGRGVQTLASFGQMTTADGPVGVATTTFRNGAAGVWSSLLMVFATPLFWITSGWMRRLSLLTMGDFYAKRYGSERLAAAYALIATVGMMGALSAGYAAVIKTTAGMAPKAVGAWTAGEAREHAQAVELSHLEARDSRTLSEAEGSRLAELRLLSPRDLFPAFSPGILLGAICLVTIANAVLGGLTASFYADVMRSCLIIALSAMLIPFGWFRIDLLYGGVGPKAALAALHARLPEVFFQVFGSPELPDFTWYYVLVVSAVAGITVVTQPQQFSTSAAARDESVARFGSVAGAFLKRVCTIFWGISGLACVLLYSGKIRDSDLVWGFATRDLLGPAGIGLVGLMFAGMLAALMSASNSVALSVAGLVTNNLYRPLRPGKAERHYVAVGRIAATAFLAASAGMALQLGSILEILKFSWEFFVIFAAAFWLGMKWRRANRPGAWASILVTFVLLYLAPLILPVLFPAIRTATNLTLATEPRALAHGYRAKPFDVAQRNQEIQEWRRARSEGREMGPEPAALGLDENFTKIYSVPGRAIFWSKGLALDVTGRLVGRGMPYLDLIALRALGVPLERMTFATVESIRIGLRLAVPFILLIAVSLCTRRDDPRIVDRFFSQMRPVVASSASGNFLAPADPRLFPRSEWEFYRWTRADVLGFLVSVGLVFAVIALLLGVFSWGL